MRRFTVLLSLLMAAVTGAAAPLEAPVTFQYCLGMTRMQYQILLAKELKVPKSTFIDYVRRVGKAHNNKKSDVEAWVKDADVIYDAQDGGIAYIQRCFDTASEIPLLPTPKMEKL